jgi:uncharacterized protein YjiS (DUF1127 family)
MKLARFGYPSSYLIEEDRGILGLLLLAAALRCRDWLQRRVVFDELHHLDERTLVDLGINRGDFDAIAGGAYQRQEAETADNGAPQAADRAAVSPRFWPHPRIGRPLAFEQHLILGLGTALAALWCAHAPSFRVSFPSFDAITLIQQAGELLACLDADVAVCLSVATP